MGREAKAYAEAGGEAGAVTVLLESDVLVLRGALRRRYERAAIRDLMLDGDSLRFIVEDEAVALSFEGGGGAAWAKAIATPAPSLATKLGVAKGAKAWLLGACDDPALGAALDGVLVAAPEAADMAIVIVEGPSDLADAVAASGRLPLWVVHPKGKGVAFGDGAIRAALRAEGYRDTKACAVSDRLTATRYNRS